MEKGDYKEKVLIETSSDRTWRAIFIARYKSKKLGKYVDGLAIIPDLAPKQFYLITNTITIEPNNASPNMDTTKVEA